MPSRVISRSSPTVRLSPWGHDPGLRRTRSGTNSACRTGTRATRPSSATRMPMLCTCQRRIPPITTPRCSRSTRPRPCSWSSRSRWTPATPVVPYQYEAGAQAVRSRPWGAAPRTPAAIYGTEATIEIDRWFYTTTTFRVIARDGTEVERYAKPYEGHGLRGEAAEVARCLRAGLLESPLMPLEETYTIMQTMDEFPRHSPL